MSFYDNNLDKYSENYVHITPLTFLDIAFCGKQNYHHKHLCKNE